MVLRPWGGFWISPVSAAITSEVGRRKTELSRGPGHHHSFLPTLPSGRVKPPSLQLVCKGRQERAVWGGDTAQTVTDNTPAIVIPGLVPGTHPAFAEEKLRLRAGRSQRPLPQQQTERPASPRNKKAGAISRTGFSAPGTIRGIVSRSAHHAAFAPKTAFVSRYSSKPIGPHSRPLPDCL